MIGHRVGTAAELTNFAWPEQPGDYSGPVTIGEGKTAVYFRLPIADDERTLPPGARGIHSVQSSTPRLPRMPGRELGDQAFDRCWLVSLLLAWLPRRGPRVEDGLTCVYLSRRPRPPADPAVALMEDHEDEIEYAFGRREADARLRRWFRQEMHHQIQAAVAQIIEAISSPLPRPASGLRIKIGALHMADPITLDVDVTGETVTANWVDDKGDVTTTPPNGPDGAPASISVASSDPTVVAVDASGALSFLKSGNATLTASAVDGSGTALNGFPTASADLVITPGTAAGLAVSVQGAESVPAP